MYMSLSLIATGPVMACHVLKQPSSFVDLLQSLLQLVISGDDSAYQEVMSILKEKEKSHVNLEEALKLTTLTFLGWQPNF